MAECRQVPTPTGKGCRNRLLKELILTTPSCLWLGVFFVLPLVGILWLSFHSSDPWGAVAPELTLETWKQLATPSYPQIIFRTLWISALTTALCILLALPCAYAMAQMGRRARDWMTLLVVIPFWTNFLIRVFAWRVVLHPDGTLKRLLVALHLASPDTVLLYNEWAIVLVSVYTYFPFALIPICAAAEKFDFSLLEAARDLGARSLRAFWTVFVPCIRQGIWSAVLMVFIPALGSYVIPDLVGGPDTELIGNKIYQRTFTEKNLPNAAALSTLMTACILLCLTAWGLWTRRTSSPSNREAA